MDIDKRTPKRRLGDEGEEQACKMLASKGFRIEQRNYSCKMGEIDIIAVHPKERVLAFVEVKTRRRTDMGLPCEAVGWKKQQKLRRCAQLWLMQNPVFSAYQPRLDIIEILEIEGLLYGRHLENAF